MFARHILHELNALKRQFRVLTLIGPRQSGKTTLARLAFPDYEYLSLEDPDTRLYASTDPRGFLSDHPVQVILDEVQRVPDLLSYIQTRVDQQNIKAQYILTGSHQLQLSAAITQSLAGRTALLTLLPLSLAELHENQALPNLDAILLNGFMPGKHADQIDAVRFYRAYFQTYVERDVRQLIHLKDASKFEKLMRLCAGRIGQLINQVSLANEVGVSSTTINEWLSVLEASFIVFRLQPWHANIGKRLVKTPKLYFIDTGLAAWLLGIETTTQMHRDPLRGNLFENMVILDVLKAHYNQGRDPQMFFYRDSHGNEVDLVEQQSDGLIATEIKSAQTWQQSFSKGLDRFAAAVSSVRESRVIYCGDEMRNAASCRLLPYTHLAQARRSTIKRSGGVVN
jgi:uncharacterized protein